MSHRFAVGLSLVILVASLASAQAPDPAAGNLPFASQIAGQYDSVDLATSNISVTIPVRSKNEKIPFSFALYGNTHAYTWNNINNHNQPTWSVSSSSLYNFTLVGRERLIGTGLTSSTRTITCGSDTKDTESYNFAVIDSFGTAHPLPSTIKVDNDHCDTPPATGVTTDGSGYTMQVSNFSVWDRSGTKASNPALTDPDRVTESATWNGSTATYTDSLNTTVMTEVLNGGVNGASDTYTYSGGDGSGSDGVTVQYTAYHQKTVFGCSGIAEIDLTNLYFPTSVSTTGGGASTLTYETTPGYAGQKDSNGLYYVTGRIQKITYPSGGSVTYAYSGGNNGVNCSSKVVPTLTRTVNDNNGNNGTWTYVNANTSSTAGPFTVTETDPAGNQTVHSFAGEYQTQAVFYQGTSTVLKTVTACYGSNGSTPPSRANCPAPSTIPSLPITETDVYTSLGTSSYNEVQTKFDATYGNVIYIGAYDFGASTPTTQVFNVYGQSYSSPTACTTYPSGTYINNTPCYSHTENSSGTDLAKTKIAYSSTGHPTSISRWVSGSTWLTSTAGFNTNGTLAWSKDAAGNQTTYAYDGSCNSMAPTSITYPLSSVGSSSQTWDCNGGVVITSTDGNNKQTTYTYNDPMWRVTNVAYPDGGHQATGYSTGTTLPWKIETVVGLDSSRNMVLWRTLDGLGRTVQAENDSDPGGTNYVQTVYNSLGQVYSVTNPFFTTADQTYGLTYYTYDALGRITQIQHPSGKKETFTFNNRATKHVLYPSNNAFTKIYQSDGLGRLTDICEVTSVTQANGQAPSGCGLDISGTGFHATNSYDPLGNVLSMNYSSVRSFIYDGLSRITSATYPESGTITYVYDSGTAGDLYQRTAPAPNQTGTAKVTATYSYDALHRLTGISYSDGTTPTVMYNYDQSSVWSHTLTNPKGRLTSAGFPGDVTAVFGYDSMGRVALHGQCTPLNCGTTNFFANYSYNYLGEPSGVETTWGSPGPTRTMLSASSKKWIPTG